MAALPTEDYRRTDIRRVEPILSGLDAWLYGAVGRYRRRAAMSRRLLAEAAAVDAQAAKWTDLKDGVLRDKLRDFKDMFRRQQPGFEAALPEALAAIREAARRQVGLYPYPVQLAGALALYRGTVAEMGTGEGKTLTAGLTAVLWGWIGRPSHVITINEYLAERDAKWLEPLYHFCGVSVGSVLPEMDPGDRRREYARDVTYTTSKEILADFLRDRLRLDRLQNAGRRQIWALSGQGAQLERGLVMRGIHAAIVDEADSILIDEAVTPLIISRNRPNEPFVEACQQALRIADALQPGVDYRIDEQFKDIDFLPKAEAQLDARAEELPAVFRGRGPHRELIQQALKARAFFHRDRQYVVQDGEVVIVDEFTGRLMPQRTWSAGLHQLIEAKEEVAITPPSETLARLSFQRFFRSFHRLSGMTGTAREAAGELWHIYDLPVVTIPPNKPSQRRTLPRRIFAEQQAKWQAIVDEVVDFNGRGQPVLIGTRSVKASQELAARLTDLGLSFRLLNAVRHREEARIVARAGEKGTITVATNMAGRGTDILLADGVNQIGGLHVIATECHESGRIDRQLFGRSGRQGDPGSARSFVSMDDELLRRYVPKAVRQGAVEALKKGMPGAQAAGGVVVRRAQAKAQRIAFGQRKAVLRTDTWLEDSLSFAQRDVGD